MYIVGDIGGTHSRFAQVNPDGTLGEKIKLKTPEHYADALELFVSEITLLAGHQPIRGIGVGVPASRISDDGKRLIRLAHLPAWNGKALGTDLQVKLGASNVKLANDAAVAGLGEAVYGAAVGARIVAYVTISTGIGGARIVDGTIDYTSQGFEPGHHYLGIEDGQWRSWEYFAGGAELETRYQVKPSEITDPAVWHHVMDAIATGIHNVMVFWSPDVVVIGGGIGLSCISMSELKPLVHEKMQIFPDVPQIVHAKLGDDAGLWGAAALIHAD